MQRITTARALMGLSLIALVVLTAACGADDDTDAASGVGPDDTIDSGDGGETSSSTSTVQPTTPEDETGATDQPSATPTTGSATTGSTTSSSSPATSNPSTTIGGLIDVRPVPITSVASVGATAVEVTVEGGVEPCFVIQRVDRVETADDVELTVYAGSEPGAVCIQIIELHTTIVDLADPLGDRAIVDGATGDTVTPSS